MKDEGRDYFGFRIAEYGMVTANATDLAWDSQQSRRMPNVALDSF
jgi:hypothetical protein